LLDRQPAELERHPVRLPAPLEAARDEAGRQFAGRLQAGGPAADAPAAAAARPGEHRVEPGPRGVPRGRQRRLAAGAGEPAQLAVALGPAAGGDRLGPHPALVVALGRADQVLALRYGSRGSPSAPRTTRPSRSSPASARSRRSASSGGGASPATRAA